MKTNRCNNRYGGVKEIYIVKKKTAYQKLKEKNAELLKDIYVLSGEGSFLDQCEVSLRWKMRIETEKMIWKGDFKTIKK